MIMAATRAVNMAFFALKVGFEFGARHRAVRDLGLGEEEVDDLVLIQRGAQLGGRHRLLLEILDEALAVLDRILLRRLSDEPAHLRLRDLDAIGLPDFR